MSQIFFEMIKWMDGDENQLGMVCFELINLYLMSEEESVPNQVQTIKTKQEVQRKFGCPCGKWYLSYPALFTHVKQKHDGKPPGALIKPKTDKARGRPRLPTNNNDDDPSIANYDCVEQLEKAILNKQVDYSGQFQFSDGSESCQDMASQFLRVMEGTQQQKRILNCFMNYIRFFVKKRYEETYWQTHRPIDIIDISNQIVRELQNHKSEFPLDKDLLVDLLYVLFRWMYKNKWTDHKLVRRSQNVDQAKI